MPSTTADVLVDFGRAWRDRNETINGDRRDPAPSIAEMATSISIEPRNFCDRQAPAGVLFAIDNQYAPAWKWPTQQ